MLLTRVGTAGEHRLEVEKKVHPHLGPRLGEQSRGAFGEFVVPGAGQPYAYAEAVAAVACAGCGHCLVGCGKVRVGDRAEPRVGPVRGEQIRVGALVEVCVRGVQPCWRVFLYGRDPPEFLVHRLLKFLGALGGHGWERPQGRRPVSDPWGEVLDRGHGVGACGQDGNVQRSGHGGPSTLPRGSLGPG